MEPTFRHRPHRLGGVMVRDDATTLQNTLRRIFRRMDGSADTDPKKVLQDNHKHKLTLEWFYQKSPGNSRSGHQRPPECARRWILSNST